MTLALLFFSFLSTKVVTTNKSRSFDDVASGIASAIMRLFDPLKAS